MKLQNRILARQQEKREEYNSEIKRQKTRETDVNLRKEDDERLARVEEDRLRDVQYMRRGYRGDF